MRRSGVPHDGGAAGIGKYAGRADALRPSTRSENRLARRRSQKCFAA
jgi:hypothetical protein